MFQNVIPRFVLCTDINSSKYELIFPEFLWSFVPRNLRICQLPEGGQMSFSALFFSFSNFSIFSAHLSSRPRCLRLFLASLPGQPPLCHANPSHAYKLCLPPHQEGDDIDLSSHLNSRLNYRVVLLLFLTAEVFS